MDADPPQPQRLIVDCAPGVDDAMALALALAAPQLKLLGLTTTFGHVGAGQAQRNAAYLCALAGRALPVCPGVPSPLRKAPLAPNPDGHGRDGLGNLPERLALPRPPQIDEPGDESAARFMVRMAQTHPGQVDLLTLGPLGNLYQALRLEPRLPQLLRRVVVMGGTITEPGDVSPVAQSTIWLDPHAADRVLVAGFPLTLVGLDVTQRVVWPLSVFEALAQRHRHPLTDTLLHAVRFYAGFQASQDAALARSPGCLAPGALALIALLRPDGFNYTAGRVRVVTEGLAQGQTILDRREHLAYPQAGWEHDIPKVQVALEVDAPACLAFYTETLMQPWLAS